MRISKKGIEDIINRLYTVEQDGEKVIRRDRLDELFTIVTGRYDNAGCSVEKVLGGERLVITSVNKNGIKKIFGNYSEPLMGTNIFLCKTEILNFLFCSKYHAIGG